MVIDLCQSPWIWPHSTLPGLRGNHSILFSLSIGFLVPGLPTSARTRFAAGDFPLPVTATNTQQQSTHLHSPLLQPPFYLAAQSVLTLCNPVDSSPPGSSVHGIPQARILEWVAMSFPRGSSQPRDCTCTLASPALAGGYFITAPPGKPLN